MSALSWRNIGPFRGGRVSAVTGAVGQAGTFYIGLPEGGVWKTTSAGQTWYPVFDAIKETSSVGSVTVAPSDPNIVYAGTGEISGGDEGYGMYKSTDAGKTWQRTGLEGTRMLPTIIVDPKDPNLVMVAATGPIGARSDQRGLFRSTDGGKTWSKPLYIDSETGIVHIASAYDHPEVIVATSMRRFRAPGAPPQFGGGGNQGGTALYKSTDEGLTWKKIESKSMPRLFGRATVAIAPNTNAQRMYLIGMFGLYRSDDGGDNWRKMAEGDDRIANGQGNYTSGVYVDPKNPDVVYTLATCSYRSLDGGKTFTGFKGAPGGDDPQQLWIDPTDGNRMLLGGDQGAVCSLDAGATWGSWYNQPTGQIYHVSTDTQYPYWVYGAQQDSGAIGTSSRGNLGAITSLDWVPHPGFEFGFVAPDPLNPKVSYACGPNIGIIKVTYPSGQFIDVSPGMDEAADLRHGIQQPLAFSPVNPKELMAGFQCLMSTTDGGVHWKKLSPDLGLRAEMPAPPANAGFFARRFSPRLGTITCFSQSAVDGGKTIWVGTGNGLIQVTKDHGATWSNVSLKGFKNPERMQITSIDASHSDADCAYVSCIETTAADPQPEAYRTRDNGKTWTKIVSGIPTELPDGNFVTTIRNDTKRPGLLFAGTPSGMHVSFDDGDHWQPLQLNLPTTRISDFTIHGNDLVVATYGRGFWILDDYSPLRELAGSIASEPVHLFKPGEAVRVRKNVNDNTPMPPEVPHAANPPLGTLIYYSLGSKPGRVSLEIVDSNGKVVRHMSSDPVKPYPDPEPAVPDFWVEKLKPMPTEPGLNRVNWNFRYDMPQAFVHDPQDVMGAIPGETTAGVEGPLASPGTYIARLTVDGKTVEQAFVVKNDPRSPAKDADVKAQTGLLLDIYACANLAYDGYQQVSAMRSSLADALHSNNKDVAEAAKAFDAKLKGVSGTPAFGRSLPFGNSGESTFVAMNQGFLQGLTALNLGDMAPTDAMYGSYATGCEGLKEVIGRWKDLNGKPLADLNALLTKNGMKPIAASFSMPNPPEPPAKYRVKPAKPGQPAKGTAGMIRRVDPQEMEDGDGSE